MCEQFQSAVFCPVHAWAKLPWIRQWVAVQGSKHPRMFMLLSSMRGCLRLSRRKARMLPPVILPRIHEYARLTGHLARRITGLNPLPPPLRPGPYRQSRSVSQNSPPASQKMPTIADRLLACPARLSFVFSCCRCRCRCRSYTYYSTSFCARSISDQPNNTKGVPHNSATTGCKLESRNSSH